MDELLKAIKEKIAAMKKIELTGFTNTETATAYFQEKEGILEGIVKTLETITVQETAEMEALKSTVQSLRGELKTQAAYPKELSEKELFLQLGRGIAAAYQRNNAVLAEVGFTPNSGVENWINPKEVSWVMGKGWIAQRAAAGDPMGDMSTADRFLINPAYENELVAIAEKKSVMMPLVDSSPMSTASVIIPVEEAVDINLEWLTAYGEEIAEMKHPKIEKVELKAHTCAGIFNYYREFLEDSIIDLGKLFVRKFQSSYAREFDKQCLTADKSPFTGALRSDRAVVVRIKANTINDLTYEELRDVVYKVPAEERRYCQWFLHETVVNHLMNLKDSNGNPIVRRPMEKMPGTIDLYPYHECHVMPQLSEVEEDTPFAVFVNPMRINHRNRRGIEIKKFDGTSESLKFGTEAIRFCKRDAFGLVIPQDHMVVLKTKAE